MKKIKLIWISIFLVLTLVSLVSSVDWNGDGIDDGEQNLCGDAFCQPEENIANCPADCENPQQIPSAENLSKNNFFSSIAFKIILISVGLIIIGVIIYLILKRRSAPNMNAEEISQ